jgi:hypothetical protein
MKEQQTAQHLETKTLDVAKTGMEQHTLDNKEACWCPRQTVQRKRVSLPLHVFGKSLIQTGWPPGNCLFK